MNTNKYSSFVPYDDIVKGEACQVDCPLHIDMPVYYDLMREGKYEDAYVVLKEANPFPALTGRVCFFPCEYSCVRGRMDTPVAIREVEYFLSDYIQIGPNKKPELTTYKEGSQIGSRSESVAIVGAGPAGMCAAWDLAHSGYKVTIYEKLPACGGMVHFGIPIYKILSEAIAYEIDVLKKLGVDVVNNVEIGKDLTMEDLKSQGTAAVCIAVGADVGKRLHIPGEKECRRIHESTVILRKIRQGYKDRLGLGDRILIIGGGNTAMDIARTCRRVGAKEVTVVYRKNRELMPAYDYEVEAAEKEDVQFMFHSVPEAIEMDGDDLVGLRCSKVDPASLEDGGAGGFRKIDNSGFVIPADSIIRAISEVPDLSLLGDDADAISEKGLLRQSLEEGIESLPGMFAAGDVVTGPLSIVAAMASGRRAAAGIDSYIRKVDKPPEKTFPIKSKLESGVLSHYDELKRQIAHKKVPLKIKNNFDLLTEKFTEEQALEESERCFRCNNTIEIDSKGCIVCNYCVEGCPVDCLTMVTDDNRVFAKESELKKGETGTAVLIKDAYCIRCGICVNVCPTNVVSFRKFDKGR